MISTTAIVTMPFCYHFYLPSLHTCSTSFFHQESCLVMRMRNKNGHAFKTNTRDDRAMASHFDFCGGISIHTKSDQ